MLYNVSIVSILCLKYSIGAPSHSKPKFLQWPTRPHYHLVPCYLYDFIFYHFSFTHSVQAILPTLSFLEYTKHVFTSWSKILSFIKYFPGFIVHICIKYKLTQSFFREVCRRCLKIVILSEPSSFLLSTLKEITHYTCKDL